MKTLSQLTGWLRRTIGLSTTTSAWLRGDDLDTRRGATLTEPLQQVQWVYACVRCLSENLANAPLLAGKTQARGDWEIIDDGPLADLLANPLKYGSRFEFTELLVMWLMLRGKAFVIGLDKAGNPVQFGRRLPGKDPLPVQLLVLNADRVQRRDRDLMPPMWDYQAGRDDLVPRQVFSHEQVLFAKLPHPFHNWDGLAPLTAAWVAAQTDFAAGQTMSGLMQNNAEQGLVFSTDQNLSEDQVRMLQAQLRERRRSAGTANRDVILGGGAKIQPPSLTMADVQFLENRKFSRQEICSVYGVPQELLGYSEDANRSVADAARATFIENRIAPLGARIASALAPLARAFDPNAELWFDSDGLPSMVAQRRARIDTAAKLWAMGYPANVANTALDIGLPEIESGDVGWLPFSVQPAEQAAEPRRPMAVTPPKVEPEEAGDEKPDGEDADEAQRAKLKAQKAAQPSHVCIGSEEYAASIAGSVRRKRVIMERFFAEQRKRALQSLDTAGRIASGVTVKAYPDLLAVAEENAVLARRLKPALIADLEFGGAQLWRELGSAVEFNLKPQEALDWWSKRKTQIEEINQTTNTALRETLSEGLEGGESIEQLATRVREVFKEASVYRSETIATTETNVAVNSGRFIGMEDAGSERKSWLSARLESTREDHLKAEKEYWDGIPVGEPFIVGGEAMMYPGDPKGSAGNTINCKCVVVAVAGKTAPAATHRGPDAKREFLSYEDWQAAKAAKTPPDAPAEAGL